MRTDVVHDVGRGAGMSGQIRTDGVLAGYAERTLSGYG